MSSLPVAPERSHVQRMEALERANEIRSYRAGFKERLRDRQVTVWEALRGDRPELATMKAIELLLAVPKVGRVKANKILAQAHISPSKTIGGLTERQRRELMMWMRPYAGVSVRS